MCAVECVECVMYSVESNMPSVHTRVLRQLYLTNSVSSTPKFMLEFTDPSLQGEVNLNLNFGVLQINIITKEFATG